MFQHSQKRRIDVISPEEKAKNDELATRYSKVSKEFLRVRKEYKTMNKTFNELMAFSAKIIQLTEDLPTAFNFRIDVILENFFEADQKTLKKPIEEFTSFVQEETMMFAGMIKKSPKSYQLWYHRQWLFKKILDVEQQAQLSKGDSNEKGLDENSAGVKLLTMDIQIVNKFLQADERNFHAWNYRYWCVNMLITYFKKGRADIIEKELEYTAGVLKGNYSNYSALHFRSKYLELKYEPSPVPLETLMEDLKFIQTGLFMTPVEQSLWLYQKWVLTQITENFGKKGDSRVGEIEGVLKDTLEFLMKVFEEKPQIANVVLQIVFVKGLQLHLALVSEEKNEEESNALVKEHIQSCLFLVEKSLKSECQSRSVTALLEKLTKE